MELIAPTPENGVPYSNEHRRRLERVGKFPKRVPLSSQRYCYVRSEIEAWHKARIAERDAPKAA